MDKLVKIIFISLVMVLLPCGFASADIIIYDPCEEEPNTTTVWHIIDDFYSYPCSMSIAYSTEQARSGLGSWKFISPACVKHNMLNPYAPIENFQFDEEYWVGFSVYVSEGYTHSIDDPYMIYAQWHGQPDNLGVCDDWRNPVLAMQDYSDVTFQAVYRFQSKECCLVPTDTCHSYDIMKWIQPLSPKILGGWNDVVYHVKFSMTSGILEQWVNGEKVLNYNESLGFNDDKGPYFTFGTYQGNNGQDLIFYYDELRIGDSDSSYAEVAPGGEVSCAENWICEDWSDWSDCLDNEQFITRTCTDSNECGTEDDKPKLIETQDCEILPTYSLTDFITLVSDWLKSETNLTSDLNNDNTVNTRDLGIMMSHWE